MVTIGDGAVGKTCLLISYANNRFPEEYVPTVFDNYSAHVANKEKIIQLGLWDTAGEEDYDRLRPLSYPETNVFLICFSLVHPQSLVNIKTKWVPEIREHAPGVPFVLCGCKLDLRADPEFLKRAENENYSYFKPVPVTYEEAVKLAREVQAHGYFETSAKTRQGVKNLFDAIIAIGLGDYSVDREGGGKEKCGIM